MYFEGHCTIHTCQYNEGKLNSEVLFVVLFMYSTSKILSHSNLIESSFSLTAFYIDGVKISVLITILRQKTEFSKLSNVFVFQLRNIFYCCKNVYRSEYSLNLF